MFGHEEEEYFQVQYPKKDFDIIKESKPPNIVNDGWTKVRHLPKTSTQWFSYEDLLVGNVADGDPSVDTKEWTIRFENMIFDEFLFATGDMKKWMIVNKQHVTGRFYNNEAASVKRSSLSSSRTNPKWMRQEDKFPFIILSLSDQEVARKLKMILYAEDAWKDPESLKILSEHEGVDVYVR